METHQLFVLLVKVEEILVRGIEHRPVRYRNVGDGQLHTGAALHPPDGLRADGGLQDEVQAVVDMDFIPHHLVVGYKAVIDVQYLAPGGLFQQLLFIGKIEDIRQHFGQLQNLLHLVAGAFQQEFLQGVAQQLVPVYHPLRPPFCGSPWRWKKEGAQTPSLSRFAQSAIGTTSRPL